ncbi:MAG: hypothetical protein KDD11_23240, partial [Acidobacteria bacterium]|nr:hypothetical protein [Acidobacteriota bacterium]
TAALLVQGAKRIPPNILLGRLRTPLRGEAETGLSHLKTWLGSGEEALKAPARRHLDRCRIGCSMPGMGPSGGGEVLTTWLRERAEGQGLGEILGFAALVQRHHLTSLDTARRILDELSIELSARLVDSLLAALAIANQETNEDQPHEHTP